VTSYPLLRRLAAEAVGTLFLLAVVVGSGVMGARLSGGNDALALLGNTLSTGAALAVLILIFGPVSGAHFNPAVTLAFRLRGAITTRDALLYVAVQIPAAFAGVLLAHAMFDLPMLQAGVKVRAGFGQTLSEAVATFGLVATILGAVRFRPETVPWAVGLFISAGYWFTASTAFANPAVTLARAFTDTFAGIRLPDAPAFLLAQFAGAALAAWFCAWLFADPARPPKAHAQSRRDRERALV